MRFKSMASAFCKFAAVSVLIAGATQARASDTQECIVDYTKAQQPTFPTGTICTAYCQDSDVPWNCVSGSDYEYYTWAGQWSSTAYLKAVRGSSWQITSGDPGDYGWVTVDILCSNGSWSGAGCSGTAGSDPPSQCITSCGAGQTATEIEVFEGVQTWGT